MYTFKNFLKTPNGRYPSLFLFIYLFETEKDTDFNSSKRGPNHVSHHQDLPRKSEMGIESM